MKHGPAAIAIVLLLVGSGLLLWWLARPVVPPVPPRLQLQPVDFQALAGWRDDEHGDAVAAFHRSCAALTKRPDSRPMRGSGFAGNVGDWRDVCNAAAAIDPADNDKARQFFETRFTPVAATTQLSADGLFTGYYEASLNGSRQKSERYRFPIYGRPRGLISVDLRRFDPELPRRRLTGTVKNGSLVPLPTRADIDAGAYAKDGLEIFWVDDAVDAFFLHIQGSGRVSLDDGGVVRVGYAAQNGRPYFAIGRELIRRGDVPRDKMSMQAIRSWLGAHPEDASAVMQMNPSFIFFRERKGEGPMGAQGVALTSGRSLAVDRRFIPLGLPIWLDTTAPAPVGDDRPLRRLMVAQDTGGAIRGPVRGDVFWGYGGDAANIAGRMKHRGRWYMLLPRELVAQGLPAS